jgi:formylglycine-generating enzyme required for sulfatase activity
MFTMPSVMIREVDPRFDAIVAKAMKYDREERYQSASEFRRALDVILTTPMVKAVDEAPELPQNPPAPDSAEEAPAAPRSSKIPPAKPRKPQSILVMSTVASVVIIVALAAAVATKKNNDTADQPILLAQANTPPKSGPGPEAAALAPDVLKRLAELRSAYDQYANTNILKPHEAAVATLEANYLKALARARDDATKKGDLDTVVAAKAEMDRLGKKEALPPTDDALPAAFKPLRVTFRTELTKLEQARDAKIPDANKRYDTALDAYQVQLTQSQQVDAALHVKGLRAELAASKGIVAGASSPPSSVASAPPPANAGEAPAADGGFTNSLGMKFVPVPGTKILMCIHETRYKDYAAYAEAVAGVDPGWKNQTISGVQPKHNPPEHPVRSMSWDAAKAFCAWLSEKEGRAYRLPTDREWSTAVGIADREAPTTDPSILGKALPDVYPWGGQVPPPQGAGNYADSSQKATGKKLAGGSPQDIDGYTDDYPTTSPVMSFKPNALGLYDLSGNVNEFCEDASNATRRIARGGSFLSGMSELHSSNREILPSGAPRKATGFRVVVELGGKSPGTSQTGGGIPPVGAPVSANRLKEIEGWILNTTWRIGDKNGYQFYFADGGKVVLKGGNAIVKECIRAGGGGKARFLGAG